MNRIKVSSLNLPQIIREGRGLTANVRAEKGPTQFGRLTGESGGPAFSGTGEFWQCVKNTPLARANECLQHLLSADGKEIEVDIFGKHKIPVKFELKPDWLWFAAGFLTAWILRR